MPLWLYIVVNYIFISSFEELNAIYFYETNLQVRIEDNIVITETGNELLTDVPRTVEEIEQWMSSGGAEDRL